MSTSFDGLQFPVNPTTHKISTSQTGKAIIAEALSIVDNKASMEALADKNWRKHYPIYFKALVEHGIRSIKNPITIATQGLHKAVGRRQDRAHQQRHPPRQIKQVMQQQPGAEDGQQHDRAGQAEGDAPGAMLERQAQFKAADKQRKQHCHFGQVLHPARRPLDVQVQQVYTQRADGDTQQQAHRRSGDRHPAQIGGREGEGEQHRAQYGQP